MLQNLKQPKWITFQLTERCNLRCKMCYQWGDTGWYAEKEKLATLDFTIIKKIIKDCLPGKPHFELFGGEPLMHPNVIEIIELIKNGGCNVDINTNGILIEKLAGSLVDSKPNRLWIALDGPERINDLQRGNGVFKRVFRGVEILYEKRNNAKSEWPRIGFTFTVTPENHLFLEEFFFKSIDIKKIDHLCIEFQNFMLEHEYVDWLNVLKTDFGVYSANGAKSLIRDPEIFKDMNFKFLYKQLMKIKETCEKRNINLVTLPKTIDLNNIKNYFNGNWNEMEDKLTRCAFPWFVAEVSANGDITVCHTFYDLPVGNVYKTNILDIWKGEKIGRLWNYLRRKLIPICTACPRYFAGAFTH